LKEAKEEEEGPKVPNGAKPISNKLNYFPLLNAHSFYGIL
jgi:hypothetical protein